MKYSSFSVRRRNSIESKKRKELGYLFKCIGNSNWQWYEPPETSAPVYFFMNTSLHGLKYLGQKNRNICERIFWLIAFIAAVIGAAVLIWYMWEDYKTVPIVTVFSPTDTTLDKIPFPSVTICSVNNIKKSKFEEYEREIELALQGGQSNETLLMRFVNMLDINHICNGAKTFTQKFYNYTYDPDGDQLRQTMFNRRYEFRHLRDPAGTLRNSSQTCEEMILFCLWLDTVTNCSDLWTQIVTDYGYCCTFNMIPLSLLRTYLIHNADDPQRVMDWKEADLNSENLIFDEEQKNRKYPYRQLYAGRSSGLSILVDPHLEEYYCTNTDSNGFVVGLNVPLDFPRMRDNGLAVRTGTEMFINARPDITFSADSARKADFEKRHCYFEGEKKLRYYTKYSASNCLDECIARKTLEECECLRYYMPHLKSSEVLTCTPGRYNCTENIKAKLITAGLDKECDNCWPSCSEIKFHTEATALRIREHHIKDLLKHHPNISLKQDRAKHVSIIHISYNVDSVFPRLRKEMYTGIELISNAGGLLGLCMGFSMLSLLEIVYHATIRLFCRKYRERCMMKGFQKLKVATEMNSTSKGLGFLSKIYGKNMGDGEYLPGNVRSTGEMFNSSFHADFQRAYHATTWPPPPVN